MTERGVTQALCEGYERLLCWVHVVTCSVTCGYEIGYTWLYLCGLWYFLPSLRLVRNPLELFNSTDTMGNDELDRPIGIRKDLGTSPDTSFSMILFPDQVDLSLGHR